MSTPRPIVELDAGRIVLWPEHAHLIRPWLIRQLVERVPRDGGQPSATVRELLYALDRAERHHDRAHDTAGSAVGSAPILLPTLEISTAEAAQRLGCSASYVRRLCRSGALAGRLVGTAWHVDDGSVSDHIAQSRRTA